jgi:hypothetical protein
MEIIQRSEAHFRILTTYDSRSATARGLVGFGAKDSWAAEAGGMEKGLLDWAGALGSIVNRHAVVFRCDTLINSKGVMYEVYPSS